MIHNIISALGVLALLAGPVSCTDDDSGDAADTPLAACKGDSAAKCCEQKDCTSEQVCDFTYSCSPKPDGGLHCNTGSGTRTCIDRCGANDACATGTCGQEEFFFGTDSGEFIKVCR